MKRSKQVLFASLFLFFSVSIFTAFTTVNNEDMTEIKVDVYDYSCTLYVKKSTGSAARSIKVSTEVSGGISCIGGRSFYTDSDGEVTLKWVSGCYLKKVYVDGRGYEVDYRDGGTYSLTMR